MRRAAILGIGWVAGGQVSGWRFGDGDYPLQSDALPGRIAGWWVEELETLSTIQRLYGTDGAMLCADRWRDRSGWDTSGMPITETHQVDSEGRPAGGESSGRGFLIHWQMGPLRDEGKDYVVGMAAPGPTSDGGSRFHANSWTPVPAGRNGAFVEDVIEACIGRIAHYQGSRFHCVENAVALGHLRAAAEVLAERTRGRVDRGVEGTHAV